MPNPNDIQNIDLDNLDGQNQDDADTSNQGGDDAQQDDVTNQSADTQDITADQDGEQYVSDEEYLAPYYAQGMPSNIKTLDDAMNWAVNVAKGHNAPSHESQKVQQLNRILAQQGFAGGIDEFLARQGNTYSQNANAQQYLNPQFDQNRNNRPFLPENPYRTTIDADIQNGTIPAEQAATYRAFANVQDRALKQITDPLMNTLRQLATVVHTQQATIQETEYRMLPRKIRENVTKYDLDSILNSGDARTYEEAFIVHGRLHKPQLLAEYFSQKGQGQMNNNGQRKKPQSMSRQNLNQRQQQGQSGQVSSLIPEKFVLPDGTINNAALDKLKPEDASKMRREILRKASQMR